MNCFRNVPNAMSNVSGQVYNKGIKKWKIKWITIKEFVSMT
jgi:hypothetical protein